jgi:transcription factor STE12
VVCENIPSFLIGKHLPTNLPKRNNLFHISGTDIVRCLSFRFHAFGRPVKNSKKFEEGIFSDLRNLKSGTDASLEEPKSPFLDFLYKNNCIRTQKKQKVFYWYSVPHDRLFLDALERDLKREKMSQEATTMAVAEPALSFEYDSSQSLFEQLTKAQQTNSSSFNTNMQSFSQPPPQMIREVDSMPPPHMMPQALPVTLAEDPMHQQAYSMPMSNPMAAAVVKSREQYDRNGVPLSQVHLRHHSVPAFMEFSSPAPSLAMSHYEEFSNPRMSFEPLTPPQASIAMGAEPAYIANEETGLYTAIPDLGHSAANFNPLMNLPPSNLVAPQFGGVTRGFPPSNVYSVIEGSPTYKQRRRRSSLSTGISAAVAAAANQPHRPSDLRRSMSSSVVPVPEADESQQNSPQSVQAGSTNHSNSHSFPAPQSQHQSQEVKLHELSRHGTPLATVEASPVQEAMPVLPQDDLSSLTNGDYNESPMHPQHSAVARAAGGVFRRARSATMMELGPYPQKSHSCPIPTCGRLFKRLEHLKRYGLPTHRARVTNSAASLIGILTRTGTCVPTPRNDLMSALSAARPSPGQITSLSKLHGRNVALNCPLTSLTDIVAFTNSSRTVKPLTTLAKKISKMMTIPLYLLKRSHLSLSMPISQPV